MDSEAIILMVMICYRTRIKSIQIRISKGKRRMGDALRDQARASGVLSQGSQMGTCLILPKMTPEKGRQIIKLKTTYNSLELLCYTSVALVIRGSFISGF